MFNFPSSKDDKILIKIIFLKFNLPLNLALNLKLQTRYHYNTFCWKGHAFNFLFWM